MKTVNTVISGMAALGVLLSGVVHAVNYSGFLNDYPMQPDPDRDGAMVYFKPDFDLAAYDKVMIVPLSIFVHPGSEYKAIIPAKMKGLADSYYYALVDALEPEYPVVNKPGPGVLQLRMAITDVMLTRSEDAYGLPSSEVSLLEAVIEAEMRDAQSGKVMGVLVDAEPHMAEEKEISSKEALQQSFSFYAQRLRQRLDAAHAGK